MDSQSLPYKVIPDNKLQGRQLTNISPTDWWFATVWFLWMVAAVVWSYRLTGTSLLPAVIFTLQTLLFCALFYRFKEAFYRNYLEIYFGMSRAIKHRIVGGIWFKANDTNSWFVRWVRNRNGKVPAMPFNFAVITAEVEDGKTERVAVLREIDRPYDHVFFAVEGGNFATQDSAMQMRLVDALASITNRMVSMADLKLGVTYLRVLGPWNEGELTQFLSTAGNPILPLPEAFDLDEETLEWVAEMQETLNELRPQVRKFGAARPINVVKLTIKRDKGTWRKARRGKLSNEDLYDLPVVELSRLMTETLASNTQFGFSRVAVMGLAELADLVRASYDVVDIQDYYKRKNEGEIPSTDEQIDEIVKAEGVSGLNARLQCWPRDEIEIGDGGKWVRIDNTYFASLRFTQLPETARADQFLNIHHLAPTGVWTRIATVGQSISGDTETRNLIYQTSFMWNLHNAAFSNRVVEDPRRRRRRQAVDAQTEEISAHTIAQYFNIVIVVAAGSARDVLRHRRTMKANALEAGFASQNVDDVAYALNVLHSGALGVNRL